MSPKQYYWLNVLLLAALFAMIALFSGCAAQKVVTVPLNNNRDSVRVETQLRVDSVWRDRWHTEFIKGDTVHVYDSVYVDRWRYINKTDSICVRDTISVPVEVSVPVRERNGYDRFTSWGFWILFLLLVLRVAWWFFKTYYLRSR